MARRLTVLLGIIGTGSALLLAYPASLGPVGLWAGLGFGSLVTAALFIRRFNRLTRPQRTSRAAG